MITHEESDGGMGQSVKKYLDSFLEAATGTAIDKPDDSLFFRRVVCCETSRSLYCQRCCRLLVPDHLLPAPISRRRRRGGKGESMEPSDRSERPLNLPFNLHIILDDRRGSATGLHAVALMNGTEEVMGTNRTCIESRSGDRAGERAPIDSFELGSVKLVDLATDELPKYRGCDDSTFLLFPSPGESLPLEVVASKLRTLVVLDCKWTQSKVCRADENLSSLQKVHLTSPPEKSFFWRWHNAGPGMLSSIEAIYYAAIEVMRIKHKCLLDAGQMSQLDSLNDQSNLIHLLWLFGHQRGATIKSAQNAGIPAPCTDEGKEMQRAMREQKGTWRQLRHKEDERRLYERMKSR